MRENNQKEFFKNKQINSFSSTSTKRSKNRLRQKIFESAKKIFSEYPFNTVTMRMIAKEAGVDHPLIHYYFGSKQELFYAVISDVYENVTHAAPTWFEGLDGMTTHEGIPIFIDRLLDYHFSNSNSLRLILLNIGQPPKIISKNELDLAQHTIHYIHSHIAQCRGLLQEKFSLQTNKLDLETLIYCFYEVVILFIGSRPYHLQVLNLNPDSIEYQDWVKKVLTKITSSLFEGI